MNNETTEELTQRAEAMQAVIRMEDDLPSVDHLNALTEAMDTFIATKEHFDEAYASLRELFVDPDAEEGYSPDDVMIFEHWSGNEWVVKYAADNNLSITQAIRRLFDTGIERYEQVLSAVAALQR